MLQHKILFCSRCVAKVFFSLLFILCRNIVFYFCEKYFAFSSSTLLRHKISLSRQSFLWFFSAFVVTIFSFVVTEFLTVAYCCCHERYLLCRNIVFLTYTTESELYVAIDLENVATYFLPLSLSLAELFVATLKSLSR